MIRDGELPMSEVKRVGKKYWWVIPVSIAASVLVAMVLTMVLPKRYTSTTVVLVDQPTVSSDIVKPVINQATNQRLASMQEEILSRTRLQPIIEKFGLYQADRVKSNLNNIDDLVMRLRDAIKV